MNLEGLSPSRPLVLLQDLRLVEPPPFILEWDLQDLRDLQVIFDLQDLRERLARRDLRERRERRELRDLRERRERRERLARRFGPGFFLHPFLADFFLPCLQGTRRDFFLLIDLLL
ncbi:MAG: hypothetical protein ACW98X_12195 [Promethearchaeota archaeon]